MFLITYRVKDCSGWPGSDRICNTPSGHRTIFNQMRAPWTLRRKFVGQFSSNSGYCHPENRVKSIEPNLRSATSFVQQLTRVTSRNAMLTCISAVTRVNFGTKPHPENRIGQVLCSIFRTCLCDGTVIIS